VGHHSFHGRGGGDEGGHGDLHAVRRRGDVVRKEATAVHRCEEGGGVHPRIVGRPCSGRWRAKPHHGELSVGWLVRVKGVRGRRRN
jgi:hypothetical protein